MKKLLLGLGLVACTTLSACSMAFNCSRDEFIKAIENKGSNPAASAPYKQVHVWGTAAESNFGFKITLGNDGKTEDDLNTDLTVNLLMELTFAFYMQLTSESVNLFYPADEEGVTYKKGLEFVIEQDSEEGHSKFTWDSKYLLLKAMEIPESKVNISWIK